MADLVVGVDMEAGVDMEGGVENKDPRDVEPDSDFTTPLPAIVEVAGVEKPPKDTAGAAVVVPSNEGVLRSKLLFLMLLSDSSKGFEILVAETAEVLVVDGVKLKVMGTVLTALGALTVRSMVSAGVTVVVGVVSGTGVESERREGADLGTGAASDDKVEDREKVKEGSVVGAGAGAGLSGLGSSKTFCI